MANVSPAIWPGSSTLPGSSTIPGQGDFPFVRCRISTDDFATSGGLLTWIDATTDLRSFSVSRGRENELSQFDSGSATIVLDDRDRQWDPTIHSEVRPMNRVWLYEEFSGETHDLFRGYAESWHEDWPDGGWSNATSTVEASDEWQVIAAQHCVVGAANPYTTLDVWVRISSILDDASNHAPRVSYIGGSTNGVSVSFNYEGQPITDAITSLLPSDFSGAYLGAGYSEGALIVTASGAFTYFYSDHRTVSPFNTAQATFGDAGGSELPYVDLVTDYSRSFLTNNWTINGLSSTVETSSDATSITQYGNREQSRTVLYDVSAKPGLAASLRDKYKAPFERVTSVSFDTTLPEVSEALFRRELMDCIRILRTPPGGGARIDQTLYIQKIEVSGANDRKPWAVRWGVSPL